MTQNFKPRVLIIGASGLVGSNCYRYFSGQGVCVKGTYRTFSASDYEYFDALDIHHPDNFDITSFRPTHIIHCGALTNVDYCERHVDESFEQTVLSTQNLVSISLEQNIKLIYLSTDYVYDGQAGPYPDGAPFNPLNVYGKHKLQAEDIIRHALTEYIIFRVTNVYGDEQRNKNFVSRLIRSSLSGDEKELLLPYDQYATPINAFDIARMLHLCVLHNINGSFNFGGNDYYSRYQLAKKVFEYFPSRTIRVTAVSTSSLNQDASRPLNGGLVSRQILGLFPDFTFTNIDFYLRENGIQKFT